MKNKKARVDFNVSSVKPSRSKVRHYSYKTIAQKLNLYSRFAKTKTQKKDMLDLKDNHFKGKIEKDAKRGIQLQHFYQAYMRGHHTNDQKVNLEAVQKEQDKKEHKKTLLKGKALYRHYSLSRQFDGSRSNKVKPKEKGLDRDK